MLHAARSAVLLLAALTLSAVPAGAGVYFGTDVVQSRQQRQWQSGDALLQQAHCGFLQRCQCCCCGLTGHHLPAENLTLLLACGHEQPHQLAALSKGQEGQKLPRKAAASSSVICRSWPVK